MGAAALAPGAEARDLEITASVTVASDYVFRGVSQTDEEPAFQAGVGWEHTSGWFGGAWTSTVGFPASPYGGDERDLEVDLYLGYARELGRGWSLLASAVRYEYPGGGLEYDYTELGLALEYRRVTASVAYADEALGFGGAGLVWEMIMRQGLPAGLALTAGAGRNELRRVEESYLYWHLALARSFGRWTVDLGYFGSDQAGERLWGERATGRLVLGLSWRIR